jgi:hypothetical protein
MLDKIIVTYICLKLYFSNIFFMITMKTLLGDITSIQTGYSFRSRLTPLEIGTISVIQMKDLAPDNRVDCSNLARINLSKLKSHHFVKPGDLVFRSRGQVATSAILLDDPGKAVVAAPLLWIRLKGNSVLPEYLNWFINQTHAQFYLASRAKGTAQKMISKEVLDNMEVFVPPLDRQKMIIELAGLLEDELKIMHKLASCRKQYVSNVLMQLVKDG